MAKRKAKKKAAKKKTTKKAAKRKVAKKKTTKKAAKKKTTKKAAKKKTTKKAAKKKVTKKKTTKKKAAKKKTTKKAAKKKTTKKKAAKKKKRKANPALLVKLQPNSDLADIVGGKALPRGQVMKKMWEYIKKNGLQDKKDGRKINTDAKLKKLFKKGQIHMTEIGKVLKSPYLT